VIVGVFASVAISQTVEKGQRAFDAGDFGTAAELFEKARKQEPARCDIHFYLGLARYRLKHLGPSLIAFQSAAKCDPKFVPAHLAVAEAYLEMGNDNEAVSAYTRALSIDPRNAAALRGAAAVYLRNQVNEKAVPLLEALVALDAGDHRARADLAAAYAATSNREAAETQYREVLRRTPADASALMGLANLLLKQGEENQAIALLQESAAAAPKAFEPRYLLGAAYNRLSRFNEALVELQAALRLGGSSSAEVHYHLARTYGGLQRPEDRRAALARFAELSRKSKEDVEAQRAALRLAERASQRVAAGDLRGALELMEEARQLRPADDRLLFRLASLQFDLRRYDLARNYVQEAISLAPTAWLYQYLLGLVEKNSGRWREAQTCLDIAIRLNPEAAEAHNALGDVALNENDPQRAIASFERAAQLDPKEPAYRLNLEAARRAAARVQPR
jgi:tetratricopeptide (TPR) repeat protein